MPVVELFGREWMLEADNISDGWRLEPERSRIIVNKHLTGAEFASCFGQAVMGAAALTMGVEATVEIVDAMRMAGESMAALHESISLAPHDWAQRFQRQTV